MNPRFNIGLIFFCRNGKIIDVTGSNGPLTGYHRISFHNASDLTDFFPTEFFKQQFEEYSVNKDRSLARIVVKLEHVYPIVFIRPLIFINFKIHLWC